MTARIDENTDPRSDYQKSQNTSEAQQYASVVDHSKDQLHDASTSSTSGNHSSIVNGSTLNEDDSLPAGHENATEKTGKLGRLRSLKQKTKHKTKKLLKLDDGDSDEGEALREGDAAVESISSDPAFNPSLLKTEGRTIHSSVKDKTIDSLQFAAKATIHPKEAIKGRATRTAGRFTKAEHPYLSREADNELLRAHADLQGARSSTEGSEDEREARTADQNMTVDKLEIRRHSMKVAWTTSRHVQRVRVAPKGQLKYPERSAFVIKRNAEGKAAKHDWLKWVGYVRFFEATIFWRQVLTLVRFSSITRRASHPAMWTILTIYPSTPTRSDITSRDWSWRAGRGSPGSCMSGGYIDGRTRKKRPNGLHSTSCCGIHSLS